jgi:hypothetical protein
VVEVWVLGLDVSKVVCDELDPRVAGIGEIEKFGSVISETPKETAADGATLPLLATTGRAATFGCLGLSKGVGWGRFRHSG